MSKYEFENDFRYDYRNNSALAYKLQRDHPVAREATDTKDGKNSKLKILGKFWNRIETNKESEV